VVAQSGGLAIGNYRSQVAVALLDDVEFEGGRRSCGSVRVILDIRSLFNCEQYNDPVGHAAAITGPGVRRMVRVTTRAAVIVQRSRVKSGGL
jgi:hypothetical protein